MKNQNNQRGSAHAVIIIVLVLALITALGWIFYQNFLQKKDASLVTDKKVSNTQQSNESTNEQETFKGKYFTIERPAGVNAQSQTLEGIVEYVDLIRTIPQGFKGTDIYASVAVYKGKYIKVSATGVTPSYMDVKEWYDQQGGVNSGGSSGDSLMKYNYKLTRERGQTNNAVIYVLKDDLLYKIALQESDGVILKDIDMYEGPTKGSATYEFSSEIKKMLGSFQIFA